MIHASSCARRSCRRGRRRSVESPRRGYLADRERWLSAAGELLERHPRARLAHALDYMLSDEILGSRALTLPGFAKVADQLLARHHARSRRGMPPAHTRRRASVRRLRVLAPSRTPTRVDESAPPQARSKSSGGKTPSTDPGKPSAACRRPIDRDPHERKQR
jgi:ribosomal protein L13